MSITPTGILTHSYFLKLMLSECGTFQAVVDASTAALARERIHFPAAEGEDDQPWPRAIISHSIGFGRRKTGLATWEDSGSLKMSLEFIVPGEYAENLEDAYSWYANQVGAILSEMEALSGTGEPVSGQTHLNVTQLMLDDGPYLEPLAEISYLSNPDEVRPYSPWWSVFDVSFF